MTFDARFGTAVLRPAHAVSHQLNRRRIHEMNTALETMRVVSFAVSRPKPWLQGFVMSLDFPIQRFSELRASFPVGVGKAVATGWHGSSDRMQRSLLERQGIAQIIQALRMGQLAIDHRTHMTPR